MSNYADLNLSGQSIGEKFGLSSPYLSRRFKNYTGASIVAAISDARVRRACCMLTETKESISVIASSTGFIDSSAFIRTFKKARNLTPGEFRKLYQQLPDSKETEEMS